MQQQQGKQEEAGEAWALPEKGGTMINSAVILGAIGEFNFPISCCSHWPTWYQLVETILKSYYFQLKLFSQRRNWCLWSCSLPPSSTLQLQQLSILIWFKFWRREEVHFLIPLLCANTSESCYCKSDIKIFWILVPHNNSCRNKVIHNVFFLQIFTSAPARTNSLSLLSLT